MFGFWVVGSTGVTMVLGGNARVAGRRQDMIRAGVGGSVGRVGGGICKSRFTGS